MINNKKNKSQQTLRPKSTHKGYTGHTISMHLKTEQGIAPQSTRYVKILQKTYKPLANKLKTDYFRNQLNLLEIGSSAKKSNREFNQEKMGYQDCAQVRELKTQRFKIGDNKSHRHTQSKQNLKPKQKKSIIYLNSGKKEKQENDMIEISQDKFRQVLLGIKKLQNQNRVLKRELQLFVKFNKSTIVSTLKKPTQI